jgi:hypothetical protein
MRNKRYTLTVRQLEAGEATSDVLVEFLTLLDGLDLRVIAIYLDRGFKTAIISNCCTPTATPTLCRSSGGGRQFERN